MRHIHSFIVVSFSLCIAKKDGSVYSEDGSGGWGGYDPSLYGIREYHIMHPSGIYAYPADSGTSVTLHWAYDNVWVYINLIEITLTILVLETNLNAIPFAK